MVLEESQKYNQLHFLVIPLGSPGHYIPTIDIAKLLAQHGVKVTIVTTPVNTIRFGAILDLAIQSGLPINFLEFPFPYSEFGLPQGCECLDDLPNFEMVTALMNAYASLQKEVDQYIEKLNHRPDCIVSDTFLLWPGETAKKFQIPRVVFDGMNCFTQMCNHVLYLSKVYESVGESESFVLPGLPDHIELKRSQLPFQFNPSSRAYNTDYQEKLRESEAEAYGVLINSFQELEQGYADKYQKVKGDKVWCIGPLSLCYSDASEKVQRVRAGPKTEKIENWIVEEGFEERTKDRALLIHGWAPQLLVLSHPAIGGFLTHCGWNSTLEGVCAGVPMVTWPQFQEQFYNEKLIVQVLGIGVCVGAQNVVHLGEEEKSGVVVKSEEFKKAIEVLMEEGKEGEERRKRAKELSKIANKALEEGGSSHKNMTRLIEDIRNQTTIKSLS